MKRVFVPSVFVESVGVQRVMVTGVVVTRSPLMSAAQVSWLGAQTMARSIKDIGRFQSNIVIGNETLFGYNVYNDSAVVTEGSMIVGFDFGAPLSHIPFRYSSPTVKPSLT